MSRSAQSTSCVDQLLRLAARYPLLTPVQEVHLGRAIRAWQDWPDGPDLAPRKVRVQGKRALDRFVCSNLKLAYRIARRYENRGVSIEDLLQSAIEGLITACQRFRPDLGYRSSSYTIWWMRLSCQQAVAAHGNGIKIPQSVHDTMGRAEAIRRQWRHRHGTEPSHQQLARELEISPEKLTRILEIAALAQVHSIDSLPADQEEDHSVIHTIGVTDPEPDTDALEARTRIRALLDDIREPQMRAVIELLHLCEEPVSVARCARVLNIARNEVQRLNDRALEMLREPLRSAALSEAFELAGVPSNSLGSPESCWGARAKPAARNRAAATGATACA